MYLFVWLFTKYTKLSLIKQYIFETIKAFFLNRYL